MSKDLEYEFNNFANLLYKDCMNLMECLKKQSEDNKPILYLGKHYQKVILPYEEYQKMCNRLESIDNANPSEALEELIDMIEYFTRLDYVEPIVRNEIHDKFKDIYWHKLPHLDSIKEALIKAEKEHNSVNLLMQELDCKDFAELRKYARCGYERLNKQYLKWEDLEFKEETSRTEVKLNETLYTLSYVKRQYLDFVYLINNDSQIRLNSANDKQFFNDLHLERVE